MRQKSYILSILTLFLLISAMCIPGMLYSNDKSGSDLNRAQDLFVEQCSKCHRKNGSGVKRIYPPLKDADYVKNGSSIELLRGMLFGRSGKIVVNGETFEGVMTTEIDNSLSDSDIALILTFVYQRLNGISKDVTVEEVRQARKAGKLPVKK